MTLHRWLRTALPAVLVLLLLQAGPRAASASAAGPFVPELTDPELAWSTFLGDAGDDQGLAVATDGQGGIYVAGESASAWGSPIRAFTGTHSDAFVCKLGFSGSLVWLTFLGGALDDTAFAIAADGGGVTVTGKSDAAWGSPVRGFSGSSDAFVARLDGSGNMVWNTFLGGAGLDVGQDVALDGKGAAFVAGSSDQGWGSPVRPHGGSADGFLARLDSAGALAWNTFLGGTAADAAYDVAAAAGGDVYVAGSSSGSWGSAVRAYSGGEDGFAARLNGSGGLVWNTFLGGSKLDSGYGIAVDISGNATVSGDSSTAWGSPARAYSGGSDAFAARLNAAGGLVWNTFLGSSGDDWSGGVALDQAGNAYVTGGSTAAWGAPLSGHAGKLDAFAAELSATGHLAWNTFVGGAEDEWSTDAAAYGSGALHMVGLSYGGWEPSVRAFTGGSDAFALRLSGPLAYHYIPLVLR